MGWIMTSQGPRYQKEGDDDKPSYNMREDGSTWSLGEDSQQLTYPDGTPVIGGPRVINGQTYYQAPGPWGNSAEMQGKTFLGKPYADYAINLPGEGTWVDQRALGDAARFMGGHGLSGFLGQYGPAIVSSGLGGIAGAVGAANKFPTLLQALGEGTGLGELFNQGNSFLDKFANAGPETMTDAPIGSGDLDAIRALEQQYGNMPPVGSELPMPPPDINLPNTLGNPVFEPPFPGNGGFDWTNPLSKGAAGATATAGLSQLLGDGDGAFENAPVNYGDPFEDAYTPIDTGGGPTGLPVPGDPDFKWSVPGPDGGGKLPMPPPTKDPGGTGLPDWLDPSKWDASTFDRIVRAIGSGLGLLGANQQQNAQSDLYNKWLDFGAPYRASLADLNANPLDFYNSPMVQGALQQGSDALARSLSAEVGNPILNQTALQKMQNYTTRGLLDQYNTRWNQLQSAGQLGLNPAAAFGAQNAASQGNLWNAAGAGLQSVFGQDPYERLGQAIQKYPELVGLFRRT